MINRAGISIQLLSLWLMAITAFSCIQGGVKSKPTAEPIEPSIYNVSLTGGP